MRDRVARAGARGRDARTSPRDMPGALERWRETVSAAWGGDRAPDAAWEVLLTVVAEGGANVPTAAIARRLGVSSERAARVLQTVPTELLDDGRVGRTIVWTLAAPPAEALPETEVTAALRRLASRPARRREGHSTAARMADAVARARAVLVSGGPVACARMIREEGITARALLPRVTPAARRVLRGHLALLHAELAMNQGRARVAIEVARRGLALAGAEPELRLRLHAVAGAASRMAGPASLHECVTHYDRALDAAGSLEGAARQRMRRWILANASTPRVLMDRIDEAEDHALRSIDHSSDDDVTGCTESRLALARARFWGAAVEGASREVVHAEALARDGALWVRGWVPRYVADDIWRRRRGDLSGAHGAAWGSAIEAAWWTCAGFGFQRALLLARVAWPEGVSSLDALVTPRCRRSMMLAIGRLHRERHGVRLEDCGACAEGAPRVRVCHALGTRACDLQTFWR